MLLLAPALVAFAAVHASPVEASKQARPRIELAFVLDTTSSMSGLIEGAKTKIWSIASDTARGKPTPDIRIALVAYRDVGDEYVTRRFDFSTDLDSVYQNLRALSAGGGGDFPEHVGRGLGEAVSKLSWSDDERVMRTIFLVGDAPPADRRDDWNYKHWARRAAEKHIVVNTIRCGDAPATEVAWTEIAVATNGIFASIAQTGGMAAVVTPYDKELATVNSEIARRSLYTGSVAVQSTNAARAKSAAELPAEAAANRMWLANNGGMAGLSLAPSAVDGAIDLAREPQRLSTVKEEELPAALKGLDEKARAAKVKQISDERKALEKKSLELAKAREAWMASNAPKKTDSFDETVLGGVKNQAKSYGVSY